MINQQLATIRMVAMVVLLSCTTTAATVAPTRPMPFLLNQANLAKANLAPGSKQEVALNGRILKLLSDLREQGGAEDLTSNVATLDLPATGGRLGSITGRPTSVIARGPDTTVVRGVLSGGDEGEFQIVRHKGLVSLQVQGSLGSYGVAPGLKNYELAVDDPQAPETEPEDVAQAALPEGQRPPGEQPIDTDEELDVAEDGSRIDVLIAYTATTASKLNGRDKVELAAYTEEASLNNALRQSLPNASPPLEVRFVGVREISDAVTSDTGKMRDSVILRNLRQSTRADLVLVLHHTFCETRLMRSFQVASAS